MLDHCMDHYYITELQKRILCVYSVSFLFPSFPSISPVGLFFRILKITVFNFQGDTFQNTGLLLFAFLA